MGPGTEQPRTEPAARAEAVIDLAAIRGNVASLAERAGDAGLMAVVKADAYGHGIVPSARAAIAGGADWLGVSHLEEGLRLRQAGITETPILAWLAAPSERYAEGIAAGLDLAAYSGWQLREIAESAGSVPARVHLKVDTGLGRGGATAEDWPELLDTALSAQAAGSVRVVGIWSHLACADQPDHPSVRRQLDAFTEALRFADRVGLRPEVRHLANSAGLLTIPELATFDLVRPGIAIYGLSPVPALATSEQLGLTPAMTLRARLAQVKRVPAGTGVSYGHTYVTSDSSTLGLVPVGYADGVPRGLANIGPVLAAGRLRPIAGTVCMDQFVLDLGDDPTEAGDQVVLFGPGKDGEPTAQDWAEAAGTISYDIVCGIGSRVVRRHLG